MKVRVKATGEIKEVTRGIYSPYQYVDKEGRIYTEDELEELDELEEMSEGGGVIYIDDTPDYWTKLEHQYAGMAIQGLLANPYLMKEINDFLAPELHIAKIANEYATALVGRMKQKEE